MCIHIYNKFFKMTSFGTSSNLLRAYFISNLRNLKGHFETPFPPCFSSVGIDVTRLGGVDCFWCQNWIWSKRICLLKSQETIFNPRSPTNLEECILHPRKLTWIPKMTGPGKVVPHFSFLGSLEKWLWFFLVGGWTNPIEKYARQIGSFPQGQG